MGNKKQIISGLLFCAIYLPLIVLIVACMILAADGYFGRTPLTAPLFLSVIPMSGILFAAFLNYQKKIHFSVMFVMLPIFIATLFFLGWVFLSIVNVA